MHELQDPHGELRVEVHSPLNWSGTVVGSTAVVLLLWAETRQAKIAPATTELRSILTESLKPNEDELWRQ